MEWAERKKWIWARCQEIYEEVPWERLGTLATNQVVENILVRWLERHPDRPEWFGADEENYMRHVLRDLIL